ncbi:MAG: sigma-70 family RNA polymerase sigma factor [Solirubrobacteraceae bacterium]
MTAITASRLSGDSDDALMERVQAGDHEAFGEIYDRYSARSYRIALSICRDTGRAEDAVQESFVSVWRSSASFEPERGALAAWLVTITRYRALDIARAHAAHSSRRSSEEQLNSVAAGSQVAEDAIEHAQALHLKTLLCRLPEAQREVITLAFYGQLTHAQIAEHLDLPPGTVKGRIRLGLEKLRSDTQLQEDKAG